MNPFAIHRNIISDGCCSLIIDKYRQYQNQATLRYSTISKPLKELDLKNPNDEWSPIIHKVVSELAAVLTPYLDQFIHVSLPMYYFSHAVVMHQTEFNNIPSHYDSEWVPEREGEMPIRHFNCLLYLNSDFEGGEIIFPLQNQVYKPESGMLLIFPTSFMFPHLTTPSIGGDRYVMGLNFYYKDPSNRRNQEET